MHFCHFSPLHVKVTRSSLQEWQFSSLCLNYSSWRVQFKLGCETGHIVSVLELAIIKKTCFFTVDSVVDKFICTMLRDSVQSIPQSSTKAHHAMVAKEMARYCLCSESCFQDFQSAPYWGKSNHFQMPLWQSAEICPIVQTLFMGKICLFSVWLHIYCCDVGTCMENIKKIFLYIYPIAYGEWSNGNFTGRSGWHVIIFFWFGLKLCQLCFCFLTT